MLVVVAAPPDDTRRVATHLRQEGAATIAERAVGAGRRLVYGGPFADRPALEAAGRLRALGWPADVRPEGGGHLAAWQAHTAPVVVGRLLVCFPWSECDRDRSELVVEIDPGRAFGTGAHPTTRLLLQELVDRIDGGEHVLDVGCGSGVLAVAAARLGATADATDISATAREATAVNARRNSVGKRVRILDTPVVELTGYYDVIVANVDAATLQHLAPLIQPRLAPGGWLGLSGISPAQVSKVEAAYHGLTVTATTQQEDWSAVVAHPTDRT